MSDQPAERKPADEPAEQTDEEDEETQEHRRVFVDRMLDDGTWPVRSDDPPA